MPEDVFDTDEIMENPDYDPEEWERKRHEEEEAKIAPYRAIAQAMRDRDDLIAELLLEVTLLEMGV